jgi:hypothetical protein
MLFALSIIPAAAGTPGDDILALFSLDQAWPAIERFRDSLGTATSGPLGALVISFFLISLMWSWLKNKFDTWSFWDLFLRLFIVAAGILAWHPLFVMVDQSMDWLSTGAGAINPYEDFYNLIYLPFDQLTIQGYAWGAFGGIDIWHAGQLVLAAIEGLLEIMVIGTFTFSILAQHITTMLLYCVGPLFLTCLLFDPLSDLWMRWVRSYLTIKVWALVMYFTLFILSNAVSGPTIKNTFTTAQTWTLPALYLLLFLISLCASFPIARGLIGGAVTPGFSGALVPAVAAGAATAVLGVAGTVVGGGIGGPIGASAGSVLGGGAGKVGGGVVAPKRQA